MNRGARRLPTFCDDKDRERFLATIDRSILELDVRIHGYALMPNHYHLLVEASPDDLASAMKSIGSRYTQWFNRKYALDGSLFRGRYRSKPVLDERQLSATIRYIHRNPLGPAGAPCDLRWTSHPAYVGRGRPERWLTTDVLLSRFGGSARAFDRFVLGDQGPTRDLRPGSELARRSPRVLAPKDIEAAVGVGSPDELEVVIAGGRGIRNKPRVACLLLSFELTSWPTARLAQRYGYASENAARTAIWRARKLRASDEEFDRLVVHALNLLGRRADAA